ncbi:SCO2521 family protein [Cryptosporangium sp. NPDC051539]|uniref:SCO2521 family protein n=1 Tax=Cryptosporangium sp. NPDC051539 TaxID=3363962 RepID=UPI0037B73200
MRALGEVHTGLLQHPTAVPLPFAVELLGLWPGRSVRTRSRPISYAVSPSVLTGVDCLLGTVHGPRPRVIGTSATAVSITGGRIIQSSTHAAVATADASRRMPWSYYLSRPGVLEVAGTRRGVSSWADRVDASPNLGAISGRVLSAVQTSPALRRSPPLRTARTQMRWTLEHSERSATEIEFSLESDGLRTVRLRDADLTPDLAAEFCADLALHDWLLTTLLTTIDRSGMDADAGPQAADRLRPFADHLLHLWMPGARSESSTRDLWDAIDRAAGLSRQWVSESARVGALCARFSGASPPEPVAPLVGHSPPDRRSSRDAARGGIFLSYRRTDARHIAGRIRDRLRLLLPDRQIFYDVESIRPAVNFQTAIRAAMAETRVMVLVIGQEWTGEGPGLDWLRTSMVRAEVRMALEGGIPIVPVTVDEADMPSADRLPSDIAGIADINALPIRYLTFDDDASRLRDLLENPWTQ